MLATVGYLIYEYGQGILYTFNDFKFLALNVLERLGG
jgi:hypothetical protein